MQYFGPGGGEHKVDFNLNECVNVWRTHSLTDQQGNSKRVITAVSSAGDANAGVEAQRHTRTCYSVTTASEPEAACDGKIRPTVLTSRIHLTNFFF